MKLRFLFVFGVTLLIGFVLAGLFATRPRMSSRIIDQWETTNGMIDIRVKAYAEQGGFGPSGAYYVFESVRHSSNNWQEIMAFRHDDPVPIPRDQIVFVNDSTAYVFMGWMYGVTADGGNSWTVWSAADVNLDVNYKLIESVELKPNGEGLMKLDTDRANKVSALTTTDFGRHWVR